MNMNFYYRFLLIVTVITGCLFIFSIPTSNWLIMGVVFGIFYYVSYMTFKNLSEERINEILCLNFFKKLGCDFSEE